MIIDADLQDPPDLITAMVQAWRAGAEVVLARRADRAADSMLKRNTAAWFYWLHNQLSKIKIPENVGDFRLLDRAVVDALKQLPERQRFMKGLFAWVGFRTVTLDYVRAPRAAGESKFSGFALWNFALEGFYQFFHRAAENLDLSWRRLRPIHRSLCALYRHPYHGVWQSGARLCLAFRCHHVFRLGAADQHRSARRIYRPHLHGDKAAPDLYHPQTLWHGRCSLTPTGLYGGAGGAALVVQRSTISFYNRR